PLVGAAFDFGSVARDSKAISPPLRLIRRPGLNTFVFATLFSVRVTWKKGPTAPPENVVVKISALLSALLVDRLALDMNATFDPSEDNMGLVEKIRPTPTTASCVLVA